jgi:hypothetical protein
MTGFAAASASSSTTGYVLLAVCGLVWVAGYAIACWVWPFTPCKHCRGSGRKRSPLGRAFRDCRRCKGTARRLRTGRRVFNRLRLLRDEGRP